MGRSNSYKEIELRQLRSFMLAATAESFSAAALSLGVSLTSVWEQVRALERKLGTTLLHRKGRNLELTEQGRLLLELIQPHLNGLDSLERIFQSQALDLPLQVQLAATHHLMANQLPEPIRQYSARHPAVRLKLLMDPWHQAVARQIETRQADFGVLARDCEERESADLDYEPLFPFQLTLLTSPEHPLARQRRVTPEDLVRYPLITMPAPSPNRSALDRILRQHQLADQAHFLMESDTVNVVLNYVRLGVGIAVISLPPTDRWPIAGVHCRPFPAVGPIQHTFIVSRKHAHLPAHVEELRDTIRRCLGEKHRASARRRVSSR